ncbi:OadG family protein [Petrotoga sp. 9PWA.NaAc.5.4]|uniref:OadG family protein n=1 Tax=Petrotoga sp. 9PWA.NaAc.5.4 TaxID=1434328 RepID=UPI000CB281BD|nr:OadG family protein [Petrotoga sp. 9PWA.NaAc.5.4]PNR95401.1 hypothetical protein X924_04960 [Petrotoga sp. 9PWA.NaAc.5.4]
MEDYILITITGLIIVFSILIILMIVTWLFRFIFKNNSGDKGKKANFPVEPNKEPIAPTYVKKIVNSKSEELSEEEIFAIVSAISLYLSNKNVMITNIEEISSKNLTNKKTKWQSHLPSTTWNNKNKKRWRY